MCVREADVGFSSCWLCSQSMLESPHTKAEPQPCCTFPQRQIHHNRDRVASHQLQAMSCLFSIMRVLSTQTYLVHKPNNQHSWKRRYRIHIYGISAAIHWSSCHFHQACFNKRSKCHSQSAVVNAHETHNVTKMLSEQERTKEKIMTITWILQLSH